MPLPPEPDLPADYIRTNTPFGGYTSGVDGSSEGGRVDTIRMPSALGLYGVALADRLKSNGYSGQLTFRPAIEDGFWCLELEYEGEKPKVPTQWHGHRVILHKKPSPPREQKKPKGG